MIASRALVPDAGQHVVEVLEQEGDALPPCHRTWILRLAVPILATARGLLLTEALTMMPSREYVRAGADMASAIEGRGNG